jgi:hypothetical protein
MMAQEMQQMAPDQAMQDQQMMMDQGQPAYPQQMPSGAPVAMPQQDMGQMAPQGSMPPAEMMQPGMAYGGVPYAAYGMEMGGYDFPYYPDQMAMGGMPRFDGTENSQVNGGPGNGVNVNTSSSSNVITDKSRLQSEYDKNKAVSEKVEGRTYTPIGGGISGWGEETTQSKQATYQPSTTQFQGGEDAYIQAICKRLKSGNLKGVTAQYAIDVLKVIDPKHKRRAEWEAQLTNCQDVEKTINTQFIKEDDPQTTSETTPETTPVEEEKLICKCEDGTEFEITKDEECNCNGKRGKITRPMMQPMPHWSKAAQTDVMRNTLMQVNPASSNVMLPGRAQQQGAYEEYQTKTDQALAALNQIAGSIMSGTSGSTGKKQGMIKDMLGKGLRASMDAVAGVQSRNVDRQRETNAQQAAIDNTNMLARTQLLNQALDSQKGRKDQRTANLNKKIYNTFGAKMAADKEMGARQQMNVTTPQYMSEYDYGFITPTGVEKPLTGANGQSLDDRIQYYLGKTGDYQKAFDMAYKEARIKSQYGGEPFEKGGYVFANTTYPFFL